MKQRPKNLKKHSIQYNIFFSMIFSSALFMIFLSLGTSYLFLRNSFSLKNETSFQQLEYISDHLSIILESTENYTKSIITNSDIQQFMNEALENPLRRNFQKDNKKIKQSILQVIQSTSFIHSVTLYTKDSTPLIATEPYSQSHLSFPFPATSSWVVGEKRDLNNPKKKVSVLSLQSPFYDIRSGQLLGYVEISIPESQIANIYRNAVAEDTVLIIDKNGIIQSCKNDSLLHSPYPFAKELSLDDHTNVQLTHSTLIFFEYFPELEWYIINEVSLFSFLQPLLTLFLIALFLTVLSLLLYIGVSHRISLRITAPLHRLVLHIEKMQDGELRTIEEIPSISEIETLAHSFNNMISVQNEMKHHLLEAEKLKRDLSFSLLQQQVNPHFLYNTLDNICSLAELEEKDTLIQLVMNLSSFYRSCLSNGKMQVTLEQELNISKSYLEILHIRYPNKFTYEITCPEELKNCSCIKLLLQPIIENSIYHGIKELDREGTVQITCIPSEKEIHIIIQDNGIGLTPENLDQIWTQENDHFGIKNIHQRIQLYYGEEYGLSIETPPEGGCKTTIIIPRKEAYSCH